MSQEQVTFAPTGELRPGASVTELQVVQLVRLPQQCVVVVGQLTTPACVEQVPEELRVHRDVDKPPSLAPTGSSVTGEEVVLHHLLRQQPRVHLQGRRREVREIQLREEQRVVVEGEVSSLFAFPKLRVVQMTD